MSKRTLFLIFALILIAGTLVAMAIYQPKADKIVTVTPTPEPVAQTILSFGALQTATTSSLVTTDYFVPINIQTFKNKVTTVQLELQYDPMLLTNVTIKPNDFFVKPVILLNQIDTKTGRITYAFGIGPTGHGIYGDNKTIATLYFSTKPNVTEKTAIIFLPKSLVTAEGVLQSVLKESPVGQFDLGSNSSSSSAK